MLPQHVVRPRDAPCVASLNSPTSLSIERNMYYLEKYYDTQYTYSNDADVNFDADVQKREELSVQPIPDATRRNLQSMGFTPIIHSAAAITTGNEEAEESYPNFDSACSTVLTNSMLNCRQVKPSRSIRSQLCKWNLESKCTQRLNATRHFVSILGMQISTWWNLMH